MRISFEDVDNEVTLLCTLVLGAYADGLLSQDRDEDWAWKLRCYHNLSQYVEEALRAFFNRTQTTSKKNKAVAKESAGDKREDGATWLK